MAIETLKDFEKRDVKVASSAATNLSFLYFLENDLQNAHKYSDLSLKADKYNPAGKFFHNVCSVIAKKKRNWLKIF
jgi:hypothetical protein